MVPTPIQMMTIPTLVLLTPMATPSWYLAMMAVALSLKIEVTMAVMATRLSRIWLKPFR